MNKLIRITVLLLLTVLLTLSAEPVAFGDTVLIGDVDGDGELTGQDSNMITRYLARFQTLDAAQKSRADFDGDGEITSYDATMILSASVVTEERPKTEWNVSMILTSDLKGNAWGSTSEETSGTCSALNLASFIKQEREKNPQMLLIDAGGSLFGSAISDEYMTYTEKRVGPMTRIFQSLQYDAILLGEEAVMYPSYMIRNDMDALVAQGTAVLGANLSKVYPLITDPDPAPWNDILPYQILEIPQSEEKILRIGLIGLVENDLAEPYDEVQITDALSAYETIQPKLKGTCDLTVLLYCGNVENDESQAEGHSLRSLLRQTSDIDLVLVSHGEGSGIRTAFDGKGHEVPVISLPDGAESALVLSVAKRENGGLAFMTETVNVRDYAPDEELKKTIRSYVNAMSEIMDAPVGVLTAKIEPSAPDALGMTDGMELLHEMQIWGAQQWISDSENDLPTNVISIAYPYMKTKGFNAGTIRYRDICTIEAEQPRYTLMLIRGAELRAWLKSYAEQIVSKKPIYSLHGLSYLLNTLNPEMPLGYLEYSSGLSVEDDDVFTLILAEDPDSEMLLRPYLDESWMTFEDRVVEEFEMPRPYYTVTTDEYRSVDLMVAFFESIESFSVRHETGWFVL